MYGLCIKNGDYKNVLRFIIDSKTTVIVDGEKFSKDKFNSEFTTLAQILDKFKSKHKRFGTRFSKRFVSEIPRGETDNINYIFLEIEKGIYLTFPNYSLKKLIDRTWELLNAKENINELIFEMGAVFNTNTKASKTLIKKFV